MDPILPPAISHSLPQATSSRRPSLVRQASRQADRAPLPSTAYARSFPQAIDNYTGPFAPRQPAAYLQPFTAVLAAEQREVLSAVHAHMHARLGWPAEGRAVQVVSVSRGEACRILRQEEFLWPIQAWLLTFARPVFFSSAKGNRVIVVAASAKRLQPQALRYQIAHATSIALAAQRYPGLYNFLGCNYRSSEPLWESMLATRAWLAAHGHSTAQHLQPENWQLPRWRRVMAWCLRPLAGLGLRAEHQSRRLVATYEAIVSDSQPGKPHQDLAKRLFEQPVLREVLISKHGIDVLPRGTCPHDIAYLRTYNRFGGSTRFGYVPADDLLPQLPLPEQLQAPADDSRKAQ